MEWTTRLTFFLALHGVLVLKVCKYFQLQDLIESASSQSGKEYNVDWVQGKIQELARGGAQTC